MDQPETPQGGSLRPATALAFATISFVTLVIFGLGMLSLLLDESVVEAPGLGPLPGVLAIAAATAVFALGLWLVVRRQHPSYWGALWIAIACYLAYVVALWFTSVVTGSELAVAAAVAGRAATSWSGTVVAGAAAIAAWGGVALVRTRAQRPRWPWEDEFDE